MRFFSILLLLLLSNAQAEKLIFSNNNEQVDITGDVVINNQNGNITVETLGGDYLIVSGDDQPVILGFYPDDYEILSGGSIDVNWTVVNAETCTASTTAGNTSWSGAKSIQDGNNSQANVSVNQLPSTLRLVCSNDNNTVVKQFEIVAQPVTNTGNPVINSFTVNSQSSFVTVSSELNEAEFSWNTTDVSGCTASASPSLSGWSGSKPVDGNQDLTITRDTVVTLTCDNLPPKSVTINYSEGGNPSCTSAVYPSIAGSKVEIDYTVANDGYPFGTNTGGTLVETFGTSQFLALSNFSTNKTDFRRRIATYASPTSVNPWYAVTWSISECPGDFTSSAVCKGQMIPSNEIAISTKQTGEPASYCIIQPGVSYYLNFVHDLEPYDQTPGRCANPSHTSCAMFTSEVFAGE